MTAPRQTIAVLGASGLIGAALAEALARAGFRVLAVARRFGPAPAGAPGLEFVTCPLAGLPADDLAALLRARQVDLVVNCVGVLQDGPHGATADVHDAFVARLLAAIATAGRPVLLVHVSVPGCPEDDRTAFSRTKRAGERRIAGSRLPFVLLRPGFVVAPAAYGGSALVRALAALPFDLPVAMGARPMAAVAIGDVVRTVAILGRRWEAGERAWAATWDLCEPEPGTVAALVGAFRARFGGPARRIRLPAALLRAGAWLGDGAARLGWSPPIRTTALREMLRGVHGQPEGWMAATGLRPARLAEAMAAVPTSVQERWFARLFLLKPLVIGGLALFWAVSGVIALTVAFRPASAILTAHGASPPLADAVTVATSLLDIGIGLAIAARATCRVGLRLGIAVSLGYMAGAALVAPELWIEPLGALVKTGPAIVLMAVALAILEAR